MALKDKLTAIANAIRERGLFSDDMTLDEMPNAIRSIGGYNLIPNAYFEQGLAGVTELDQTNFAVSVVDDPTGGTRGKMLKIEVLNTVTTEAADQCYYAVRFDASPSVIFMAQYSVCAYCIADAARTLVVRHVFGDTQYDAKYAPAANKWSWFSRGSWNTLFNLYLREMNLSVGFYGSLTKGDILYVARPGIYQFGDVYSPPVSE